MQVEIKDGKLVITLDAAVPPTEVSKSGKSLMVATTNGNIKTSCEVEGKPLVVSVNAYIKR